jgi:hypothetical protein
MSATKTCADDIKAAVLHSSDGTPVTQNELQARVAEFKHLVKTAQRGSLRSERWDRVRRWPDLWELRWSWDDGTCVRGYFHEPEMPWLNETVLARVHVKWISPRRLGGEHGTTKAQDSEIDIAHSRIVQEAASVWGLPSSEPVVNSRHT